MKIIIFGGTRYTGKHLVELLKKTDHDVYVLARRNKEDQNIKFIECDRKNEDEVKKILLDISPDVIIDMICFDVLDMKTIINSIKELSTLKHYIFISTFYVYNYIDENEKALLDNIDLIEDRYTKNKVEAENLLYKSDLFHKSSIVRLPFIFSYDDYSNRFQNLISMINDDIVEIDDKSSSFICKEDAAEFLFDMVSSDPKGIVDAANDGCIGFRDIIKIAAFEYDKEVNFINGENKIYPLKRDICLSSKKITKLRSIQEAILEEVRRLKEFNENKCSS